MYYMTDDPSENVQKMGKTKKVMSVSPDDFPYIPDTGTPITGVKTMEHCEVGYELTRYLDRHIDEGTIALKDVVVELCGEKDWKHFSEEWEHPDTNADAFCEFLIDNKALYPWGSVLVLETDDSIMFVPIYEEDDDDNNWGRMSDLNGIVNGLCTVMNTIQPSTSSTKKASTSSLPLAKAEVKPNASVNPLFEPAFKKF